jgi:microcystin degradation protein MlrC
MEEPHIDFEDAADHIDDLAKEDINGRQIRNAITTARRLA